MYRVKNIFCLPSLTHFLFTSTYYILPFFMADFDIFLSTVLKGLTICHTGQTV